MELVEGNFIEHLNTLKEEKNLSILINFLAWSLKKN
jgi:hypothetical protein